MRAHALTFPSQSGGPALDFLTDPNGFWTDVGTSAVDWLATQAPLLAPCTAVTVAGGYLLRRRLHHRRQHRLADGARCVEILVPPFVAPKGGEVLWAQLSGLLRPWWRRITTGQPHLAFEYTWSHTGLRIRLWVPGTVPLGLARRAVEAAWPGAHTRVTDPVPLLPRGHPVAAGRLRPARPGILPLRTDHPTDPLRALLQVATGMAEHEAVVVVRRGSYQQSAKLGNGLLALAEMPESIEQFGEVGAGTEGRLTIGASGVKVGEQQLVPLAGQDRPGTLPPGDGPLNAGNAAAERLSKTCGHIDEGVGGAGQGHAAAAAQPLQRGRTEKAIALAHVSIMPVPYVTRGRSGGASGSAQRARSSGRCRRCCRSRQGETRSPSRTGQPCIGCGRGRQAFATPMLAAR